MGLNVVTDMWVGDMNVEIVFVEHPARLNCRFLDEYKKPATPPAFETRLSKLRLSKRGSTDAMPWLCANDSNSIVVFL